MLLDPLVIAKTLDARHRLPGNDTPGNQQDAAALPTIKTFTKRVALLQGNGTRHLLIAIPRLS